MNNTGFTLWPKMPSSYCGGGGKIGNDFSKFKLTKTLKSGTGEGEGGGTKLPLQKISFFFGKKKEIFLEKAKKSSFIKY